MTTVKIIRFIQNTFKFLASIAAASFSKKDSSSYNWLISD